MRTQPPENERTVRARHPDGSVSEAGGAARVDGDTLAILRLVDGDPIHERDRAEIVAEIVAAGREHRLRHVDPNAVRARLAGSVYPRCIGAVYAALRYAGVLEPVSWTTSTDKAGRNAGKPARVYRLVDEVLERASDA